MVSQSRTEADSSSTDLSIVNDPWIPVLRVDGRSDTVSLRTALCDAHEIRSLAPQFPQEELPIVRILLAVLYRAFAETNDHGEHVEHWSTDPLDDDDVMELWFSIYHAGRFPKEVITRYCDGIPGGASLFDPNRPFFQVPGLEYDKVDKTTPIFEKIPDVPDKRGYEGENKFLFSPRAKNYLGPVTTEEAARILIYLQAYDLAGIHSPAKGSKTAKGGKEAPHGSGYLGSIGGLFNQGSNLFETLMFNWVLIGPSETGQDRCLLGIDGDLAPWDDDYDNHNTQMDTDHRCTGPVDALTWQSRRIRLIPDTDKTRVGHLIITYGNVVHVLNATATEMMTVWREDDRQLKTHPDLTYAVVPILHHADTYMWQGLPNILGASEKEGKTHTTLTAGVVQWVNRLQSSANDYDEQLPSVITVHSQGLVYDKYKASVITGVNDTLDVDSQILNLGSSAMNMVIDVVSKAESVLGAYKMFLRDLAIARGDHEENAGGEGSESLYSAFDHIFRRHLRNIDPAHTPVAVSSQQWRDDLYRSTLRAARTELQIRPAPAFGEHTFSRGALDGQTATSARALGILRSRCITILEPTVPHRHDAESHVTITTTHKEVINE